MRLLNNPLPSLLVSCVLSCSTTTCLPVTRPQQRVDFTAVQHWGICQQPQRLPLCPSSSASTSSSVRASVSRWIYTAAADRARGFWSWQQLPIASRRHHQQQQTKDQPVGQGEKSDSRRRCAATDSVQRVGVVVCACPNIAASNTRAAAACHSPLSPWSLSLCCRRPHCQRQLLVLGQAVLPLLPH